MTDRTDEVWRHEDEQLSRCIGEIRENLDYWSAKKDGLDRQVKELYDHYHSNNPELISDLMVSLDRQSEADKTLRRNMLAQSKPYFGRIDFTEDGVGKEYSLYIGKNGITRADNSILITDWRAPVSGVYYESVIGRSSFEAPAGCVNVDLRLKRTFEIEDGGLLDINDTDLIANDAFLMKYLSKNKEAVLGEIIATIQKEQNDIIRDTPWQNIIVQGAAGSGKTTVAMHRISYLLYNYKEQFKPNEFYIIGSNRMLLNYITGVLPDLDVYGVNQMTMEEFFLFLLEGCTSLKKSKVLPAGSAAAFKGSMSFIAALDRFISEVERDLIPTEPVLYNGKVIMATEEILSYITAPSGHPARDKAERLNDRLQFLLRNHLEMEFLEPPELRAELRKHKNTFGGRFKKVNILSVYAEFLDDLLDGAGANFEQAELTALVTQVRAKKLDLYDLAALAYIRVKLLGSDAIRTVRHMVIDEAQDFGVTVFCVLKRLLKNCTFSIMGDISQNINYSTGMNDWSAVRNTVFSAARDHFHILAKSYRNTVEISEFAGSILSKCSFETYIIEPVIRHGKPVSVMRADDGDDLIEKTVQAVQSLENEGYGTLAVICRDSAEAKNVYSKLSQQINVIAGDEENACFAKGVMVVPIGLTKGLEFDAVILYNPTQESYPAGDATAKLLYVAATRALHELRVLYTGEISRLLKS